MGQARTPRRPTRLTCLTCLICLILSACSSPSLAPPQSAPALPAPVSPQQLWGDLKPVVSVKELMRDMIDPASDFIFDAVKVVMSPARHGRDCAEDGQRLGENPALSPSRSPRAWYL